jgi:RNA polymerase sigma factor (sigma-70 family)
MLSLQAPVGEAADSFASRSPNSPQSGARLAAGRRFVAVVLPHLAAARSLARRLTGNHVDSQDVVQDACMRALHGIGGFADGDARAWVLTIVRRSACDWLNKNRHTAMVFTDDLAGIEHTQPPNENTGATESGLIDRENESLFGKAIDALPAHYRQTVALRYRQGLTYAEIARATGISIGTVMSRLSRARRHLIKRMEYKAPVGHRKSGIACRRSARVQSESLSASLKHSIGQSSRRCARSV